MSASLLPYAPSESVGLVPERLERLTAVMAREVAEKKAPGVSMMVARHGKVAYQQCVGDLRPGGPAIAEDAIFRIYSMTKPIVSVAAMMLVEEGRLIITDPVSKYVPAFAEVKVGVENGDKLDLAPANRPITIQDLMRHTSGLTYGFTGGGQVQKLVAAGRFGSQDKSIAEHVEGLAALPLQHQPGSAWEYGLSTDVLGRVVEIVSGGALGEVLRDRIFSPLGMDDTAFFTPPAKLKRQAEPMSPEIYQNAGIDPRPTTAPPKCESAGSGLLSTIDDYARFLAMLSGGGALGGARILGPRTIAYMASDHLGPNVAKNHYLIPPGHGFGLGFAVRTDPGLAPSAGSVGEYYWGGFAGTAFWISPRDSLFAVLMVQAPDHRDSFRMLFRNLVNAAIA